MTDILDLKRPLKWLGPKDDEGHLWALQDGRIFNWSDGNVQFEIAWWLKPDGSLIEPMTENYKKRCENIARDRPFDPAWLS